ncbi:MAG: hypothetical protein KF817_13095 [Phycisphaeraceae bacterium]|nr:hypothetical protein [Phycisphaeraceae bacterium]
MLTPTIPATAALSAILLTLAACRTGGTTTGDGAVASAATTAATTAVSTGTATGGQDAAAPTARPVATASPSGPSPGDAAATLRRPGYDIQVAKGRLWVFRAGSKDGAAFLATGEPAKSITRPGAGPEGMTIRAVDAETIDGYLHSTCAFAAFVDQGRLWVFRDGSKDLESFLAHGEPARSVTRPGAGPGGMTIRSGDAETIDAYMTARARH